MKNRLVILGKAPVAGKKGVYAHDDWPGCEVWTVGTAKIGGADRYYEFHGLEYRGRAMWTRISGKAQFLSTLLPLNNSVCAMLAEAWAENYTDITLAGCPMSTQQEYIEQKPAVGMMIGFLRGIGYAQPHKGMVIRWLEEPERKDYYFQHIKK